MQHGVPRSSSTIFALASGALPAAIAVLRISGPETDRIVAALAGNLPPPRQASLRRLQRAGELLDEALVLRFPAPRSYTGEDAAELHLHAGPAVIAAVSDAVAALGAIPAEPGEFTRRACLAGRLGVLEAEAIADLVAAETQAQRRQALLQMSGALGARYEAWAGRLRGLLAQQEALIDFPDEDLPPETSAALEDGLGELAGEISDHLQDDRRGERVRSGITVAIVGAPNAGKSSLLNALSGDEAAIVSPRPGTTRDAITVRLELDGVLVTLVDTAGLRDTADEIEAEGMRRSRQHARQADLVLLLAEPGATFAPMETQAACWHVRSKADLLDGDLLDGDVHASDLTVSTLTPAGMAPLRARLAAAVAEMTAHASTAPLTRVRHRVALEETQAHLQAARMESWPELRGEAMRLAMHALGRLTGRVGVEDLLDTVFGQFCIGK